jgi:hypothetical protein
MVAAHEQSDENLISLVEEIYRLVSSGSKPAASHRNTQTHPAPREVKSTLSGTPKFHP